MTTKPATNAFFSGLQINIDKIQTYRLDIISRHGCIQSFCKKHFLSLGDSKLDIKTKISNSIFLIITLLSTIYIICKEVNQENRIISHHIGIYSLCV